jgi:hypothetical protein
VWSPRRRRHPTSALRNVPKLALIVALFASARILPAQTPQVIKGQVATDSGVSVPNADVIVTVAPSVETFIGKSDSTGAFRLEIPPASATGQYILYVSAVGRESFRQRVTLTVGDTSATINVRLKPAVATISTVVVRAKRARPEGSLGTEKGPTVSDGLNRQIDGVANALPPELQGNLAAMAALVPGLTLTNAGPSAFGLGPQANLTTLNGVSFSGASIPRDLATTTTFLTSPWDPTRGGFSGALASVNVDQGTNISSRRTRLTLDAPLMQAGGADAARFGQEYAALQLGDAGSGAIVYDKYFYNYGIQVARRTANIASLQDLNGEALAQAGVARDSALRLTEILAAQGVPLTSPGIRSQRTWTSAQFLGRFDRSLPRPEEETPKPEWHVLVGGDYMKSEAATLSPTASRATGGSTTNSSAFLQGFYSTYFGKFGDYVNQTTNTVSYRKVGESPYLALPSGNVMIASALPGVGSTLGALSFGGAGSLPASSAVWNWDLTNQTDFLLNHNEELPAKFYLQSRYEHYDQSLAANRLGAYTFASLDDLARNAPSSFSRNLNTASSIGGEWTGASALGASWSTTHLILAGGARVDANVFTAPPLLNPLLASAFGVRNDQPPNSVAFSPRLGFNWYPTAAKGPALYFSKAYTTYRTGYQFRGGIGEFRSFLPSQLLTDAVSNTGLPGAQRELLCTGPATPAPDWSAFAIDTSRIPAACADNQSIFADTAPNVTLLDPSYTPSRAWRGTLGWTNTIWNNYLAIDAVYSLNLNQPGRIDLNFAGLSRDLLSDEGNRPLFVARTSIDPSTGSTSAVDSRRTPVFGPVIEGVSDLRGVTRQVTLYTIPNIPLRYGLFTLGYTYADARSEMRGFDASAAGDPRAREWSPSFIPRHQLGIEGAKLFMGGGLAFTFSARVMSGWRYTPVVEGDVNGDGTPGDRAFIFDPSVVADTSVAAGLRELLRAAPLSARRCLSRQVNAIAGRNSCVGPWSGTANASIILTTMPGTSGRGQASVNFFNPLGALDRLLHGSQHMRGWGALPFIDETLYRVRGFDPAAGRFIYQVNPRFGSSRTATNPYYAPFRITLDVRMELGPSRDAQKLELNLRVQPPLAGTRAAANSIKERYVSGSFVDLYQSLSRISDSLALSTAQVEQMQARDKSLRAEIDSIYGTLADYLAALPPRYDARDALRRVRDANDAAWGAIYAEAPFLRQLLTPGQIRLLPRPLIGMLTTPNFNSRFFF